MIVIECESCRIRLVMEKTMGKENKKLHPAWLILVACCLINASALGLTNSNGMYFPEICRELGISISTLSIHTIVSGLSSAVTLFFVDKAYARMNTKALIAVNLLIYHLSYIVMYFFTSVVEFCMASVFTGIASAFLLYIPVPMLINNWFVKSKKTALSICFVASGFSGILISMLLGWTIPAFGWRASYVIRSAFGLLLAVPVLFIVKKSPAEAGLKPYGADAASQEDPGKVFGDSAERHTFKEKRFKLIFAVFLAVSLNLSCGMVGHLPNYADVLGMGVMMGSVLTSLAMVGNISSKAVFGPLTEKFGVAKVTVGVLLLTMAGFLLTGFGLTATAVICVTAVTTGMTACANTLVIPNLADTFVNGDEYVHVLARCSTGTMIASAFCTMVASSLYDLFGSYTPVFLCYAALEVVNIAVMILVFGRRRPSHSRR